VLEAKAKHGQEAARRNEAQAMKKKAKLDAKAREETARRAKQEGVKRAAEGPKPGVGEHARDTTRARIPSDAAVEQDSSACSSPQCQQPYPPSPGGSIPMGSDAPTGNAAAVPLPMPSFPAGNAASYPRGPYPACGAWTPSAGNAGTADGSVPYRLPEECPPTGGVAPPPLPEGMADHLELSLFGESMPLVPMEVYPSLPPVDPVGVYPPGLAAAGLQDATTASAEDDMDHRHASEECPYPADTFPCAACGVHLPSLPDKARDGIEFAMFAEGLEGMEGRESCSSSSSNSSSRSASPTSGVLSPALRDSICPHCGTSGPWMPQKEGQPPVLAVSGIVEEAEAAVRWSHLPLWLAWSHWRDWSQWHHRRPCAAPSQDGQPSHFSGRLLSPPDLSSASQSASPSSATEMTLPGNAVFITGSFMECLSSGMGDLDDGLRDNTLS